MKITTNLNELNLICKEINKQIEDKNHIIFLIYGDIGAGKTTLIKKYTEFIKLKDCVTSPTFSLMHKYDDKFFHYDLYNRNLEDLLLIGILELLGENGIHFVECNNLGLKKFIDSAYENVKLIKIKKMIKENDKRTYEFSE